MIQLQDSIKLNRTEIKSQEIKNHFLHILGRTKNIFIADDGKRGYNQNISI